MNTTPVKPQGASWVNPYLVVDDVERALRFYEKAFGLKSGLTYREAGKPVSYGELHYKDALIMVGLPQAGKRHIRRTNHDVTLFCYTSNVDRLAVQAKAAGAQMLQEPADQFWGDRTCLALDPDGHAWMWAQHMRDTDT